MEPRIPSIRDFVKLNLLEEMTHFLLVGELVTKGIKFIVELTLSKKAPTNSEFLISNIKIMSRVTLWNFREEGFKGLGKLVFVEKLGEHIIVLMDYAGIQKVIPVADLPNLKKVLIGGNPTYVGGRNASELLQVKIETARQLKMKFIMTESEQSLYSAIKVHQEAQIAEKRVKAEEERQARIASIMQRPEIHSFSEDGKKLFGIPVMEEEWMSLPRNKRVILVESIDKDGASGKHLEAFFVGKDGAKCYKSGSRPVGFSPKPSVSSQTSATVASTMNFVINNRPEQVLIVDSKKDLEALRSIGLNSGTLVAIGKPDSKGRYGVLALKGTLCETVGHFEPMKL